MFVVLVKMGVTVCVVVGLSVVAEHVSPRVAGVLSGYPLGAAIALFFIGWEVGPDFAAASAVYTLAGLVGTLCFVYVYYQTAVRVHRYAILWSSITASAGYFAAIGLLNAFPLSVWTAFLLPVGAAGIFIFLFRRIQNSRIHKPIRLSFGVLFLRAVLSAVIILGITGAARAVGARWAGLFSAFPTTLFPLLIIVHATYGRQHVYTIIKNFPKGLGSLMLYTLGVSIFFPRCGVVMGSVLALVTATVYLVLYALMVMRFEKGSMKGYISRRD